MLDEFLTRLRASGTVDSPGAFTISREEALQKLGRRPFGSLPWLINSALEGGATWLRFYRLARELVFEHDGRAPASLDAERSDDLTLGLLVAARQGVVFQGGSLGLSAGPGRWDVRACAPQPHQQIRFACPPDHEGLYYWLDRLKLAPLPVDFEGERWNKPQDYSHQLVSRTTERARLYLGRSMFSQAAPGRPTLTLVLGGLSVIREPDWPDAQVVAYPTGLQRTVEGDDVVENDAYRALLDELHATLQTMARELEEQTRSLPPAIRRQMAGITERYLTS